MRVSAVAQTRRTIRCGSTPTPRSTASWSTSRYGDRDRLHLFPCSQSWCLINSQRHPTIGKRERECKPNALFRALCCAQVELLGTLLASKKVDINSRREAGDTPMHWVVREQAPPSLAKVDFLGRHHPNLELLNDAQKTPLHCAMGGRCPDHVRRLLALGAKPNARGAFGSTPLMVAAALGLHDNMKALLESEAVEVDAVNENGDTALNRLARLGSVRLQWESRAQQSTAEHSRAEQSEGKRGGHSNETRENRAFPSLTRLNVNVLMA